MIERKDGVGCGWIVVGFISSLIVVFLGVLVLHVAETYRGVRTLSAVRFYDWPDPLPLVAWLLLAGAVEWAGWHLICGVADTVASGVMRTLIYASVVGAGLFALFRWLVWSATEPGWSPPDSAPIGGTLAQLDLRLVTVVGLGVMLLIGLAVLARKKPDDAVPLTVPSVLPTLQVTPQLGWSSKRERTRVLDEVRHLRQIAGVPSGRMDLSPEEAWTEIACLRHKLNRRARR